MENKVLTNEVVDFLNYEGYGVFHSIGEYVEYIFSETNFHDGMVMLKALEREIDGYILTQDEFTFIGNTENIYLDIEYLLELLEYDGEIYETE